MRDRRNCARFFWNLADCSWRDVGSRTAGAALVPLVVHWRGRIRWRLVWTRRRYSQPVRVPYPIVCFVALPLDVLARRSAYVE